MKCIKNLSQLVTLAPALKKDGRNLVPNDLDIITDGAIVFNEQEILWVGKTTDLPVQYHNIDTISKPGHVLTPELVDAHTHLVFAGDRSHEYTMRLNGADYQTIANNGGGILNTMQATLMASEDELFALAKSRIETIQLYGIGSLEIKSGYALTYDGELKLTRVINRLKQHFAPKIQIHNTFMAAHAVPVTFKSSSEYMDQVVFKLLANKEVLGCIDSVDIFYEQGYFTTDDTYNLFKHCQNLNIPVRIHADEFNDNQGAIIACEFKALSADHLLCTGLDGVSKLAQSNTVAVLLPGTAYFLGKPLANAKAFLSSGCKVALASDFNPGSCHCDNLILIASIAAKNMGFNIAELWAAITLNAACALNLKQQGALVPGLKPRFSIFQTNSIDQVTYNWGKNFAVTL
jgi:imidazolonepropionase